MLSNRTDLRKIREVYSKALKSQKRKILVCCGTGCLAGGSMDIHNRLKELIEENRIKPVLIIAVPVGFVNVVEAKEIISKCNVPVIVARGRKGGSNLAAAICNGILYGIE